jgi:putative ABC transport system permease protein
MRLTWAFRDLGRYPLRTALSLLGIAVASAMLLDMVMLSGGLERSFERLLLGRGYQIRLSPKGTLPLDTEATLGPAADVVRAVRADPGVAAAGAVLGGSLYARLGDSLVPLFGYGIDPSAQALYEVLAGSDLTPGDTTGILLSRPAADALGLRPGQPVRVVGGLDPQLASAATERTLEVRGLARWLYDYRGQRSAGLVLPLMQRLTRAGADRASVVMVRARSDADVGLVAARLAERQPRLQVSSVTDLVQQVRERLVYFRQLSYILGSVSLVVTVLLVATLLAISVNERLGEIATLRAIGVSRHSVVAQVVVQGIALTTLGGSLGVVLGLATARYLDAILTSFPGLPAAISFFVPDARTLATAAAVLLAAGALAGLYPAWLAARAPIAATLRAEAT